MIFNRSYTIRSKKSIDEVKQSILGKHIQIHSFDFESIEKENVIKIFPHAENTDKVTTLPITNIKLKPVNGSTKIYIDTHPRRIDVGGMYILVIMAFALFFAGFCIGIYGDADSSTTAKIMMGIPLVILILFGIKIETGYFDYVRKIKNWVKSQV